MLARRPVWVRLEPPCFFFSASLAEQTQGSHHESRGDTVSSSVATMTDLTSSELLFKNMFPPFPCYKYNFFNSCAFVAAAPSPELCWFTVGRQTAVHFMLAREREREETAAVKKTKTKLHFTE